MRYLFSSPGRAALRRLAEGRTLCAFDFDGTLAPIVERPEQARMRARTRRLLTQLTALYPCIVISGRARKDLLPLLDGINVRRAIGNHGIETGAPNARLVRIAQAWHKQLEPALALLDGVWIEDKGVSLAVHYRRAKHRSAAREAILDASHALPHVRIVGGKLVVNLLPEGAPDKGVALEAERRRLRCDNALYVGDDDNDEDAFAVEANVVGVRVGVKRGSRARFYVRDQREIDELLDTLLRYRRPA